MSETPKKAPPAADLASIVVLVTPFIGALGALAVTGTIGRVQRNEAGMTSWALILVLFAGTLWLVASQFPSAAKWIRLFACVPAVIGFALGLSAAVDTTNDEPRPRIEASLSDDARKLTAEVTASSMETDDRLAIFIDAFNGETGESRSVYYAFQGPDADGNADTTVSTAVPPGPYDYVSVQAFTGDETECALHPEEDQPKPARAAGEDVTPEPSKGDERVLGSGMGCAVLALVPKELNRQPEHRRRRR